jgi:cytochrome c
MSRRRRILARIVLLAPATPAVGETGDAVAGEAVFRRECAACHEIGAGAVHRVGPQLNGIFGRRAGSQAGYGYSRALLRQGADGLVWDWATLGAYVENPRALVSGTRMAYRGLREAGARADLLAYLRAHSDLPQAIPEAAPTGRGSELELPPEVLALAGDVEYGAYLAQECLTCHQRSGSDAGIPAITGWPEADFVVAMHAYRRGLRPNAVMQMVAGRLGDEEIAALAAWFATQGE